MTPPTSCEGNIYGRQSLAQRCTPHKAGILALLPLIVMDARPPPPDTIATLSPSWELGGVRMELAREEGCYMAPNFPRVLFF